jgi:hypothetical protein
MKSIKLKSICPEVLITLNNLRNCEIDEEDGSVSVTFPGHVSPSAEADEASPPAEGSDEGAVK